jgi:hypothetical protein
VVPSDAAYQDIADEEIPPKQLVVPSDATYQDIADEEIPPTQLVVPSDAAYEDIADKEIPPTELVVPSDTTYQDIAYRRESHQRSWWIVHNFSKLMNNPPTPLVGLKVLELITLRLRLKEPPTALVGFLALVGF